jgi:hypothetical protein
MPEQIEYIDTPILAETDYVISELEEVSIGTSSNRSGERYAVQMLNSGTSLTQSGDIALYGNVEDYGVYFNGAGTFLIGGKGTRTAVNSTNAAHGIYATSLEASYLDGGSDYSVEAYGGSHAYALETARFCGDFDWGLDANAAYNAYGWKADDITVEGDLGGGIAATTRSSYYYYYAYGIHGNLTVKGDITGTVKAKSAYTSYNTAYGIYGSVSARNFTGHITANAATAYGIYNGSVSLSGSLGGEISAAGSSAYGIYATALSAASVVDSKISASGGSAYALYL